MIVFDGGSPRFADGEGRKADSTDIGPVHLELDDCGPGVVPAKPRRLLRGHRDAAWRGGYSAPRGPLRRRGLIPPPPSPPALRSATPRPPWPPACLRRSAS